MELFYVAIEGNIIQPLETS